MLGADRSTMLRLGHDPRAGFLRRTMGVLTGPQIVALGAAALPVVIVTVVLGRWSIRLPCLYNNLSSSVFSNDSVLVERRILCEPAVVRALFADDSLVRVNSGPLVVTSDLADLDVLPAAASWSRVSIATILVVFVVRVPAHETEAAQTR